MCWTLPSARRRSWRLARACAPLFPTIGLGLSPRRAISTSTAFTGTAFCWPRSWPNWSPTISTPAPSIRRYSLQILLNGERFATDASTLDELCVKLGFAEAKVATAKPSFTHSSSRVLASVAKRSPLSRICNEYLRIDGAGVDMVGDQFGHDRGQQKAVPVKAVDVDIALRGDNPRPIVGKSGAHARAKRQDLRLAEGRVPVSYTHLRAHETDSYLVCRLLLEKKKKT